MEAVLTAFFFINFNYKLKNFVDWWKDIDKNCYNSSIRGGQINALRLPCTH